MKFVRSNVLDLVSGSGNHNSDPIDASQIFAVSFHSWKSSGDFVGTVKIQASNQVGKPIPGEGSVDIDTWVDLAGATITFAGGEVQESLMIPKFETSYKWLRVVFTSASGTGNLSVFMMGLCA